MIPTAKDQVRYTRPPYWNVHQACVATAHSWVHTGFSQTTGSVCNIVRTTIPACPDCKQMAAQGDTEGCFVHFKPDNPLTCMWCARPYHTMKELEAHEDQCMES